MKYSLSFLILLTMTLGYVLGKKSLAGMYPPTGQPDGGNAGLFV
jgi:hypothetical protein